MQHPEDLMQRLACLERQLRWLKVALSALLMLMAITAVATMRTPSVRADEASIIRTRGIVVEDGKGNPRILIGAPIPVATGRKRQSEVTNGIVLLEETGADRLIMGDALPPQVAGKVLVRNVTERASGFWINDADGNERGGYITSGDEALLTLDYRNSDAFHLTASVDSASMVLRAPGDRPRAMLVADGDKPAKLLFLNAGQVDMLRIDPQTTKRLSPAKGDREFFETLRNTSP